MISYTTHLIQSFKDSFTLQVYHNRKGIPPGSISSREMHKAFIWLDLLNLASQPQDLDLAPDNPLRHVQGDCWELHMPKGWTISFIWTPHGPAKVSLQRNKEI